MGEKQGEMSVMEAWNWGPVEVGNPYTTVSRLPLLMNTLMC